VSDRNPTDFPIARGVSPPPRPFRRVGSPPASPPQTPFTFGGGDRVVVRRPVAPRRSMLAPQIAAVVMLASFCMAAGWWWMHGRDTPSPAPIASNVSLNTDVVKPATQVIVKPVQPVEKPVPPPASPPKSEQPVAPPVKPNAPPPKPADKPTTLTFQKDILPILQAKCVPCHGDRNKFKGGLDVRTLRTLEKGGDTGPAINRQEPELSPLWDSVSSGQMPPGKNKLTESEKKKLHDWLVGAAK
jgi:outer membrane biosynthesis protein TonB